jgi:DNA-binding ferritin-like protein
MPRNIARSPQTQQRQQVQQSRGGVGIIKTKKTKKIKKKPVEILIIHLMNARNEAQLFHWQTKSYAEHKTLDGFVEEIQKKLDEFAEILQGMIFRRLDFSGIPSTMNTFRYKNSTKTSFFKTLSKLRDHLVDMDKRYNITDDIHTHDIPEHTNGLDNVRDEIVGLIDQTRYLLTFL